MDDIRTRIENDFGQENIYKLIYAGKILKDDQTLKSYKINPRQFIVLMITKPHKPIEEDREENKDMNSDCINSINVCCQLLKIFNYYS